MVRLATDVLEFIAYPFGIKISPLRCDAMMAMMIKMMSQWTCCANTSATGMAWHATYLFHSDLTFSRQHHHDEVIVVFSVQPKGVVQSREDRSPVYPQIISSSLHNMLHAGLIPVRIRTCLCEMRK